MTAADPDTPAGRLAALARELARLAPDRRDPERFHLDRGEMVGELRRLARELDIRPLPLWRAMRVEVREPAGYCPAALPPGIGALPRQPHCMHCRRRLAAQSRRHRLRLPGSDLFQWAAIVLPG